MPATAFAHDGDEDPYTLDFVRAPADTLPWGQLAKAGVTRIDGRSTVQFLPPVLALEGTQITLYGYMTVVDRGATHRRFLISMHPLLCRACTTPTAPEGIVEVNLKQAAPGSAEPLAVRGALALVRDDPDGLMYRLVDASVVPPPADDDAGPGEAGHGHAR